MIVERIPRKSTSNTAVGTATKLPTSRKRAKKYINEFKQVYGRQPKVDELKSFVHGTKYHRYLGYTPPRVGRVL